MVMVKGDNGSEYLKWMLDRENTWIDEYIKKTICFLFQGIDVMQISSRETGLLGYKDL